MSVLAAKQVWRDHGHPGLFKPLSEHTVEILLPLDDKDDQLDEGCLPFVEAVRALKPTGEIAGRLLRFDGWCLAWKITFVRE